MIDLHLLHGRRTAHANAALAILQHGIQRPVHEQPVVIHIMVVVMVVDVLVAVHLAELTLIVCCGRSGAGSRPGR